MKKVLYALFGLASIALVWMGFTIVGNRNSEPLDTATGFEPETSIFAEIDANGVVTQVIVASQSFIDSGRVGDPKNWIKTSINTIEGVNEKGTALRKNYAGIGYTYDRTIDAFIPPKKDGAIVFDEMKAVWVEPVVTKTRIATTTTK